MAPQPMHYKFNGRALKVTIVIDPNEIVGLKEPTTSRTIMRVTVAGRTVTADIAGKALRKAQAAIREHGVDGVAIIIQGKLVTGDKGDTIADAGLVAQPKKPAADAPAPAESAAA